MRPGFGESLGDGPGPAGRSRVNRSKSVRAITGVVRDDTDDADEPLGDDIVPRATDDRPPSEAVDDTPTITCSRCDREWDLAYELDEMGVGNQAVEQFALDHRRHTGHFPDDVGTWRASCRNCPERSEHLRGHAAERWAKTHARHTGHAVELRGAEDGEPSLVEAPSES
jgi:hypothetical protein